MRPRNVVSHRSLASPRFLASPLALLVLAGIGLPRVALAAGWEDATAKTIGVTAEWSNKLELADINGDGRVDIMFANGAGYSGPDGGEQSRAFLNQGAGKPFIEVSEDVFGVVKDQARVIKAGDVDGDGDLDLVVGNTFETQSRLYLGDGAGGFMEASGQLPQGPASIGDLEFGDVDADGDLDLVLADWGPGKAGGAGGVTKLWTNDGAGNFSDATAANMPAIQVSWSWELELADVDNDLDLDVLVSCKTCSGSFMFHNDGAGKFVDASDQLPQFKNNYEFEAIDLNGDDFVDLVTINDGPNFTEHIFLGDGIGGFDDATDELWPDAAQDPGDDNMVAFLDVDNDGDADFVICGLFGNDDRLIINDGAGNLSLQAGAFSPANSPGSLAIGIADLDGDHRPDVVFAEGETPQNAERVFFGVDVPVDTAAPKISLVDVAEAGGGLRVRARIHDNKTPVMGHDFDEVVVELLCPEVMKVPMTWYGEALWRADIDAVPACATAAQVCAADAAGNRVCGAPVALEGGGTSGETGDETGTTAGTGDPTTSPTSGDASGDVPTTGGMPTTGADNSSGVDADTDDPVPQDPNDGGCGCRSEAPGGGGLLLGLGGLLLARRRRR
ncbi:MAG: VCBS repeat-containing protein [Nannocystis sp.]|nr:VCBS repeat-containing protein [Nannocystis sp.]MBA3549322.1 VCBS repeat-containing protein [Nannocystis sp.]